MATGGSATTLASAPGIGDTPRHADFHCLRHSFITALANGGVDLATAQELAGHSTPVLTKRYTHKGLPDLAKAVVKLPEFLPKAAEGSDTASSARPMQDAGVESVTP